MTNTKLNTYAGFAVNPTHILLLDKNMKVLKKMNILKVIEKGLLELGWKKEESL